jgi:hypothetical protein
MTPVAARTAAAVPAAMLAAWVLVVVDVWIPARH